MDLMLCVGFFLICFGGSSPLLFVALFLEIKASCAPA